MAVHIWKTSYSFEIFETDENAHKINRCLTKAGYK